MVALLGNRATIKRSVSCILHMMLDTAWLKWMEMLQIKFPFLIYCIERYHIKIYF